MSSGAKLPLMTSYRPEDGAWRESAADITSQQLNGCYYAPAVQSMEGNPGSAEPTGDRVVVVNLGRRFRRPQYVDHLRNLHLLACRAADGDFQTCSVVTDGCSLYPMGFSMHRVGLSGLGERNFLTRSRIASEVLKK